VPKKYTATIITQVDITLPDSMVTGDVVTDLRSAQSAADNFFQGKMYGRTLNNGCVIAQISLDSVTEEE